MADETTSILNSRENSSCGKCFPGWMRILSHVYSVFILANVSIGSGLLNFPQTFRNIGGIWQAFLLQLIVLVVIVGTAIILIYCSELSGIDNYQMVVKHYTGNIMFVICNILLLIHCFGTCVSLLVVIGDQMDLAMSLSFGSLYCHHWYLKRSFIIPCLALILILPFLFTTKTIGGFKFISILGVSTTVYIVGLILAKYFTEYVEPLNEIQMESKTNFEDMFLCIPTIIFSYGLQIEVIPMYADQKHRKMSSFIWVIIITTLVVASIYNSVGCVGYLMFGTSVTSDVLMSYYPDVPVRIGMVLIALKAALTYPILFYIFRLVLEDLAAIKLKQNIPSFSDDIFRCVHTIIFFTSSILMAITIPNLAIILPLIGTTVIVLAVSLPGACLAGAHWDADTITKKVMIALGILLFLLGIAFTVLSLYFGIKRYLGNQYNRPDVLCN